jgi:hypothetical protein
MIEVLWGLACASCATRDELWHDVLRGVIECRACGDRAFALSDAVLADEPDDEPGDDMHHDMHHDESGESGDGDDWFVSGGFGDGDDYDDSDNDDGGRGRRGAYGWGAV